MTTIAVILTLISLVLAIGEGSAMQLPLAVAIIFSLLAQMPLVLVVMPILCAARRHSARDGFVAPLILIRARIAEGRTNPQCAGHSRTWLSCLLTKA